MKIVTCTSALAYGAIGRYQICRAMPTESDVMNIDFRKYFLQSQAYPLPGRFPDQHSVLDVKVSGTYYNYYVPDALPDEWTQVPSRETYRTSVAITRNAPVYVDSERIILPYRYATLSGYTSMWDAYEGYIMFPGAIFATITSAGGYYYDVTVDSLVEGGYYSNGKLILFRDDPNYAKAANEALRVLTATPCPSKPSVVKAQPKFAAQDIGLSCVQLVEEVYYEWAFSRIDERFVEVRDYLCMNAISNCKNLNVNYLEFWKDIPSFGNEFSKLPRDVQKVLREANSQQVMDILASDTLQLHYGTNLTLSDLEHWQTTIKDFMWDARTDVCRRASSRTGYKVLAPDYRLEDGDAEMSYNIYYDPLLKQERNSVKGILDALSLAPTYTRVWNLIPFSFVVDWSAHVDQLLLSVDATNVVRELPVYMETIGTKYEFPIRSYPGLSLSYYRRGLSLERITATPAPLDSQVFDALEDYHTNGHYVESGALLWQNMPKKRRIRL